MREPIFKGAAPSNKVYPIQDWDLNKEIQMMKP